MKRKRLNIFINALVAFMLIFSMLVTSTGAALAGNDQQARMNPHFLKLAQENPEETFKVIVQRDAKSKDLKDMELEETVKNGGGKVKKQLGMIESFSAKMSGKEVEKLAKNPKVRFIPPDAPVVSTSTGGLSTVLDRFDGENYAGNNGTENWNQPWQEVGDFGNVAIEDGSIRLNEDGGCEGIGYCLRFNPKSMDQNVYIYHLVRLRVHFHRLWGTGGCHHHRRQPPGGMGLA